MVLLPEEVTVRGKEKSQLHIHVIDLEDPEEEQHFDDAPKSPTSESPHEVPSSIPMELPLSPPDIDVDASSIIHDVPTVVDESPQDAIPILVVEPPLDYQQESLLEIFEDTPACIHLLEIDTSTSGFEEFMRQSSCPLVTEQAMVAIQTDTSSKMTMTVQTETASPLLSVVIEGELMALPPWLSSFTPKRTKYEISPDVFDYHQLRQSRPKVAKRATTISRVTVDSNKMKVTEIVEPLVDKPHEEMQAADYRVTRVELGKKAHVVVKHDAQQSVASLVQRYDELLAKKDKLEEENRQLVAAVQRITQSASEGSNPSSSSYPQESIQGVERAAQKVQALESWVDRLHDLCAQVLKEVFQMMLKLKTIEEQLNQVSDAFK